MTVTTVEPTTIEHLDFELPCQSKLCSAGHPPATHILIWHMPCRCYPSILYCLSCVERVEQKFRENNHFAWHCKVCRKRLLGYLREFIEIRPL